jgi:two-component system phosphate regulon response regulator PhoB
VTPQTILIVDDDLDTLEMYDVALSGAGYRALTARSVEAAVRTVSSDPPSAVVTDLNFPGPGGWALIRQLKSDPLTRPIPIVVLSGWFDSETRLRAEDVGCATVLLKPCLPDELAEVLRGLLQTDTVIG